MRMIVTSSFMRDPERLAALGRRYPSFEIVAPPPAELEAAPELLRDADAVFGTLTSAQFANARRLRWVQSPSAGVEWIARVDGLADSEVVVTNMRGAHAATIAEHAFALLLALTRALPAYAEFQRQQDWALGRIPDKMVALKGLTMGVVGFGHIGRAIARRATGFEMRVLAVDAQPVPPGEGVEEVWPLGRLDELCRASDVLAIAAPITPQTRGLIGPAQIELLRPGAYVLALSRGGIVDEPALIEALRSGRLAGAGLDVTATEPLPAGDPLWTAPNLLITPHSSAVSKLTFDLVWSILEENIGRFLRGEPLVNMVDKRRGY
jgi:phosphoglycerate dehydrogenase-like enzyme